MSKNWFARKHDILLFYTKTSRNVHTFVICHLCGNECLVADVEADEHPDIPPSYVCRRCAAAYSQYEIEMMRVEAYRDARMSDNYFCSDCGSVTSKGSGWCEACATFDQVFEEWMFGMDKGAS